MSKLKNTTKAQALTCHGAGLFLTDVEEGFENGVGRRGAVDEEEVLVVKAGVGEPLAVVDLLVEPHDAGDVVQPEVGEVGLGRVERVPVLDLGLGVRPAERQELFRHQPVEVPVLDLLVMFVLVVVKVVKVEET